MKYLCLLLVFLFLIACSPVEKVPVSPEKSCSFDSDCFPSECCHANDSVNLENAPKCSGIMCTMDCVPGTIDCGQGEIKCLKNQCRAVMKK